MAITLRLSALLTTLALLATNRARLAHDRVRHGGSDKGIGVIEFIIIIAVVILVAGLFALWLQNRYQTEIAKIGG